MEVTALGNGRYRVADGTRTRLAYGATAAGVVWVFLDGQVYVADPTAADRRPGRASTDDSLELSAPMPATVVSVDVEQGQTVTQGHVMIMLEAMKMELPIKAPRDGRVKAILCRRGELVQPGVPLLELE